MIQGIGHVGETVLKHVTDEGGKVIIADINQERLEQVRDQYGAVIYSGDDLYTADVDIYAPCALGATINDDTIHKLKADIIAGAANNQLADETIHGRMLQEKGIVYAPDFLINAGGIINVYAELEGYDKPEIMRKTENIYHTTLEILNSAKANQITTHQSALKVAQDRIEKRKAENKK